MFSNVFAAPYQSLKKVCLSIKYIKFIIVIVMYLTRGPCYISTLLYSDTSLFRQMEITPSNSEFHKFLLRTIIFLLRTIKFLLRTIILFLRTIIFLLTFYYFGIFLFQYSLAPFPHRKHKS